MFITQDLVNPVRNFPQDYGELQVGDVVTHRELNRFGRKLFKVTAIHKHYFDCESPVKTHYSFTRGSYMCREVQRIDDPDYKYFYGPENRRAWKSSVKDGESLWKSGVLK